MNEIDRIYHRLCGQLVVRGSQVGGTRELNNVKVVLEDITQNIISIRDISYSYLFGEWLWYFTGRNDTRFISAFGSMWERLTDDGEHANSAYGYLMKHAFGFDQIEKIIELLQTDPDSRRAVINLNIPNERVIETKDEPCTIFLQFLIRDGKLHCTGVMRSNDIYLGFPYDVAFFTELQKYIADRLEVGYGTYTHFVTSLHLYDRNFEDVRNIVMNPVSKPVSFDRIKFHSIAHMLAIIIENSLYLGSDHVKEQMIALAEDYFDFKEEWEHEN